MAGGRPGVDLWVSLDGFGKSWKRYSLPTFHNQLAAAQGVADWGYCDAEWGSFVKVAANHTFAGDPTPKVSRRPDCHSAAPPLSLEQAFSIGIK